MDEPWQPFQNTWGEGSRQAAHLLGRQVRSADGGFHPSPQGALTTTTLRPLLVGVVAVSLPALEAGGSSSSATGVCSSPPAASTACQFLTSMDGGPGWGVEHSLLSKVASSQSPFCRAAGSSSSSGASVVIPSQLASSIPDVSTCILVMKSSRSWMLHR